MTDTAVDASRPTVIAHRGFAGSAPENTVRAARRAVDGPGRAEMVEVDVMPTGDGTVVCYHDSHLHATETSRGLTDARGTVWETDDETVLSAEVLESGETVPRLAEVFDALPAAVGVNVELKNPGTDDLRFDASLDAEERAVQREVWDPFVASVVDVVDRYDNDALVSSFYEAALAAVRDAAPSVPIGVLTWDSPAECLAVADRYDAEAVHPPWNLIRGTPFGDTSGRLDGPRTPPSDLVADAHGAGRAVNVWTVDTWYRAERLRRAGVDGLIADYPCLLDSGGEGEAPAGPDSTG